MYFNFGLGLKKENTIHLFAIVNDSLRDDITGKAYA